MRNAAMRQIRGTIIPPWTKGCRNSDKDFYTSPTASRINVRKESIYVTDPIKGILEGIDELTEFKSRSKMEGNE
jgi:hypothetical protein